MLPHVGSVVHYVAYGTPGGEFPRACRAAIVTEVYSEETVSLAVFNPTGVFFNSHLTYSRDRSVGGSWHWTDNHAPL